MKSVTAVCASNLNTVASGRVHRQRRDVENEEIQMYLSKLKELVPDIPKNRRLSKLEVIQYVIDYIGDLQFALESHPSVVVNVNNMIATGTTTTPTTPTSGVARSAANHHATTSPRQPLGVLAPNTIVPVPTIAPALESTTSGSHIEKSVPSDSRQASC